VKDIPTIKQGIDKILNNEKELLNFRDLIFFDSNLLISCVLVLLPIKLEKEYIFPIMYLFHDGRKIIRMAYSFSEADIETNHMVLPKTSFYSYHYPCGLNIYKEVKEESNKEKIDVQNAINSYTQILFEKCGQNQLIQDYNIFIITNEGNQKKQTEKKLYSISKSPYQTNPSNQEIIQNKFSIDEMTVFSNAKKSVIAIGKNRILEMKEKKLDIDIQLLGNIQGVFELILLKRFANLMFSSDSWSNKDILKAKKKRREYLISENLAMFSNYYSGVDLYCYLKSKIIPRETEQMLQEIESINMDIINSEIENKLNNSEFLISSLGVLLSVIFSYEPIKSVTTDLGVANQKIYWYIGINIFVIIFIIFNRVKSKNK
ncbi:hypothetical protein IET36_002658, partial [Enterococcus faecalis]|nr:hypothetical protein [Enterococcus faecalis]